MSAILPAIPGDSRPRTPRRNLLRLEQEVDARGAAYVILALDMSAFVPPESHPILLNLRGRKEFHDFLRQLELNDPRFVRSSAYIETEQRGYELGVFNRILAEENFPPTYQLNKKAVSFPPELLNNVQFKDRFLRNIWNKWDAWFRLSGNGIVTIILKRDIARPRTLISLSRDVMGLQGYFDMESARTKRQELLSDADDPANQERIESIDQFVSWVRDHAVVEMEREFPAVAWQMAVEVVGQFVEACRGKLCNTNAIFPFELPLSRVPDRSGVGSIREQYMIFSFNEMGHYKWDEKKRDILTPSAILTNTHYGRTIAGLLEGIILQGKKDYFYPPHNTQSVQQIVKRNVVSWDNEMCIITDQSTIIYPYMPRTGQQVVFSAHHMDYAYYWECVLRALEFGVEIRLLAQLAQHMTSACLGKALPVLRDNGVYPDAQQLLEFDTEAANVTRLLSHLRTITSPWAIAQANYAVNKLAHFMEQTGVPSILSSAEANLADLSNLIERSNEGRLQLESQKLNELALWLSVIFGGLTFSLAVLTLPSFIADLSTSNRWYYGFLDPLGEILVLFLVILGIVMMIVAGVKLLQR
ncbi:MAG: hypothetical protein H6650_14825 [Ardenticatenales bacterium]|nr:hypothetical protein [Ardenticatenales bacterium]